MKHLDKQDTKRKAELETELDSAYDAVKKALTAYNETVASAWGSVSDAIEAYNEVIANADALKDEVVSQIDDYIGDKSEAWTEGERGQAYSEWKDNWDGAVFETIDCDQPDDLNLSDMVSDHPTTILNDLEVEPAL